MEYSDPKHNAWVGIDPGATGACALLNENDHYDILDWEDEFVLSETISEWKEIYNIKIVVVEAQHSMPKQGVSSTFKFGINYGLIRGVLAAQKVHTELVSPQVWQRVMLHNADGPDTKSRSLVSARRHFPNLQLKKSQHGRSDAILMALFSKRLFPV
jgi:crossover junction endodeoxyribonuclease RuvC